MTAFDAATLLDALTLSAGYNAALVCVGAALLGAAAGGAGVFLYLRKRALMGDAVAHATLPGVAFAFLAMVAMGGDGRHLGGLMLGAALSAAVGLVAVEFLSRRTRLAEDAAIGAVLSSFFGLGVVLLTVIQSLAAGRAAGLEGFLLGSTAGMLAQDAATIAVAGAAVALATWTLRRPMTLVAFDAEHAASLGVDVRRVDLAILALATGVTVIGLTLVGLVLIVAMLITPAVTARFWTERVDRLLAIAAGVGAASGYVGAALSAAAPAAPTGPLIVLSAAALFTLSLLLAPTRGGLAWALARRRFQRRVHLRQGLLAIARDEPVLEPYTRRVLRRAGLARGDGGATEVGRARAEAAAHDESRWRLARELHQETALPGRLDGLTPIEEALTGDQIAEIDRRLAAAGPRREAAR